MRKLIDYIKTIKSGNQYFTYCTLWDDPSDKEKQFPNERVGVGKTKEVSVAKFMEHEKERQKLLKSLQTWQQEMRDEDKKRR